MGKLVHGVGINDADYITNVTEFVVGNDGKRRQRVVWRCPFYQKWKGMLERSYSEKFKSKWTTYKDVTVCKEWHLFSNFKSWMETQDWGGKQLDKDVLLQGNKIYCPHACVFVSRQVNMFLLGSDSSRGGNTLLVLVGASTIVGMLRSVVTRSQLKTNT